MPNTYQGALTGQQIDAIPGQIERLELRITDLSAEVYDVTANNDNAKFASLSALLSSKILDTLIPTAVRKGGMSIKFVQSSDNKYVQYRLMSQTFSVDAAQWEKYNDNVVGDKTFFVTDSNGYIIAKIDKDGVHSVDFKIGEEGNSVANALDNIATQISNAVAEEENRAKEVEATKLDVVLSDNAFYFTDTNGYIICKIDAAGVHSVNIDEEPNKIDNDSISIEDSNGYIIARIDRDGIHSAKDKHAVACMVLSESYYPIATPTRDSDGNIIYIEVMFETGIGGSLTVTYTNGNPSSVAVVYGNYNYTITINRDTDGNVETVSVN